MACWWFPMIILVTSAFASDAITRHVTTDSHGLEHTVFYYSPMNSSLDYKADSGVCETTTGVRQWSGYGSVGEEMNTFFWLFEARKNSETAPLVLFLAGGPGGASESYIFMDDGPCTSRDARAEPSLNPYSHNEFANMLCIDQPIATGFSYGNNPIDSTAIATDYIWKFLQAFLADFKEYQGREFGILGHSYGGHTAPALATDILDKNAAVERGDKSATHINLTTMGLFNALFNVGLQARANLVFAHKNNYRSLINDTVYKELLEAFEVKAAPAIVAYYLDDVVAWEAGFPEYAGLKDVGNICPMSNAQYMPFNSYMNDSSVRSRINANHPWRDDGEAKKFYHNGDDMLSAMPDIERALQNCIKVNFITGDADYVCSWNGVQKVALALQWPGKDSFTHAPTNPYAVSGRSRGTSKVFDNLALVTVFGAGHDVPWCQPETALQVLKQMFKGNVSST